LGDHDVALLVKHPRNRPSFGHVAAVFAEDVANFADGTIAIVSVDVEHQSNTARTVTLKRELFIGRTGKFAGPALDRSLEVTGGHISGLGSSNRRAQPRI